MHKWWKWSHNNRNAFNHFQQWNKAEKKKTMSAPESRKPVKSAPVVSNYQEHKIVSKLLLSLKTYSFLP